MDCSHPGWIFREALTRLWRGWCVVKVKIHIFLPRLGWETLKTQKKKIQNVTDNHIQIKILAIKYNLFMKRHKEKISFS